MTAARQLTTYLLLLLLLATGCQGDGGDDGDDGRKPERTPSGTPTGAPLPTFERYVALGDSMTTAPYLPVSDPAGGCFRSSQNYPSKVAKALRVKTFVDVSCGGAMTDFLLKPQFPDVAPQLDAVTKDTDLVTMTLGANDFVIFRTLFVGCARLAVRGTEGSPCSDRLRTAPGEDSVREHVDLVRERLVTAFGEIRERAPKATIVLLGYPQLVPDEGTCPDLLPLAEGDYPFVRELMARLDERQRQAARDAGVRFVDVYAASKGHDICAKEPWVNGTTTVPGGAAGLHPFPVEQEAVAELLLEELRRPD